MADTKIVVNDTELKRALAALLGKLAAGARQGLEAAAKTLVEQAKANAPVGETGELRDSIGYQMEGSEEAPVAIVGSSADYAAAVELGSRNAAAQPFLLPAFEAKKDELVRIVGEAVKESLGK
jgi:HK97 gp10 family phage protein